MEAIVAQRPQARLDKAVLRGQIDALKPYFGTGARVGAMVGSDWTEAVKTLSSVGLIGTTRPAADYYVEGLAQPEKFGALATAK
ncbi:Uncharacterised protein [Mycobacteroides abscessus subsp. abscessus]|nr:Uncharacterised protein [Mycobacteroides abscessus subsp. abscessus]